MSFDDSSAARRLDHVETRLDVIEADQCTVRDRLDAIETEQGTILREATLSHEQSMKSRVASERAVDAVLQFAQEYRKNEAASYRKCRHTHLDIANRLETIERRDAKEIPPPTPVETTLNWELDEPTNHGNTDPSLAASLWAERARAAAAEIVELRKANQEVSELRAAKATAEVARAAAEAILAERSRHSDRARDDARVAGEFSVKRWQIITGAVVTLLGSGAGLWAVIQSLIN
jgi:hypothetical protein